MAGPFGVTAGSGDEAEQVTAEKTFELVIAFADPTGAGAPAVKEQVVRWLAERGVTEYVEGVIDGVSLLVETEDADAAFAAAGATPLSIYEYDGKALEALRADLVERFGASVVARVEELETRSWSAAWDTDFQGVVTERFVVTADDDDGRIGDGGRIVLRLERGAAFGRGDHATTEACLRALESLPESVGRGGLLDVGTGTGILAIAGARLGFAPLVGTDIAPDILAEARRNAARHGVEIELDEAATPPLRPGGYAVVAANILVPVLHQLMPRLAAALAPGGRLLLAGFIEKDVPKLLETCAANGLALVERFDVRGWLCLVLAEARA
jgi:ribosomal protein L11 methyltransferase